ncbi:MAG: bacteriohemerythrin [Anaerolineales bacterium]|nr:bacteriohemerythrin [Anaerolineales bacterium]
MSSELEILQEWPLLIAIFVTVALGFSFVLRLVFRHSLIVRLMTWALLFAVANCLIAYTVGRIGVTVFSIGIGVVGGGLATITLLWAFRQYITRPLQDLAAQGRRVALGDTQVEPVVRGADELADMAGAFRDMIGYQRAAAALADRIARGDLTNAAGARSDQDTLGRALARMAETLRHQISQMAASAARANTASLQLASASREADSATRQIAATVGEVSIGTQQQAESLSRSAQAVEDLERAIDDVAHGAQEQAGSIAHISALTRAIGDSIAQVVDSARTGTSQADAAAQTARDGATTVAETLRGMQTVRGKVGASVQAMDLLSQRSAEIGVIGETIEEIASQTNLLALNAAIEAARAGEQGRGFAVVAGEVRKLAERASASAHEIGGLIQNVQVTIRHAAEAMHEGAAEADRGVAGSNRAGSALTGILASIEGVHEQVRRIAQAADLINASAHELVGAMQNVAGVVDANSAMAQTMAQASASVTGAIEHIASVGEEISASVDTVTVNATGMSAQVAAVTSAAQSLAEMADNLQLLVGRFQLAGSADQVGADASLLIAWDDAMETGDRAIDQQHRELIRQLNGLAEAMSRGAGRDELTPLLDFLAEYVQIHFSHEEGCMARHNCPAAAQNQEAHQKFVVTFTDLRARIERDGPQPAHAIEIRRVLSNWLVNHITRVDTQLKPCLAAEVALKVKARRETTQTASPV